MSPGGASASGVPGIAIRQLIGTLSGCGSNSLKTSSTRKRSSALSPIPIIPATAYRHPAALHCPDGIDPVLKGVCANDSWIKVRRGIDVVIVSGYAGGPEFLRFVIANLTKGDA